MLPSHLIESVLESAPDAIVISDESGCIVFVSQQVGALFGYERGELLGRPIEQLLPQRLRGGHAAHRRQFAMAPRIRPMGAGADLRARRKDGSEFPVEISLSPIHDRDRLLVAAAIRDVTLNRRIQSELMAAREAADRANQAKSRFLATASHDLRQPLQSLALLNGTLQRMVGDPEAREVLAHHDQAIGAMSRLLNALLDISKLESGAIKPEISDFTVASLFDGLRLEFAELAVIKGLELYMEPCEDTVRSDPSLLEQILRNLVSNAIKYTLRGRVLLRCLHLPSLVRLEVADTGIGIPADQLPYIFDEFFQVGVRSNAARNGYGLGLSIVIRIVKLLGLTLDVHSEPGKGTSFRLDVPTGRSLPCHDAHMPAPESTRHGTGRRTSSARVLLVEDDAGVRDATRMLLKTAGYEVVTADSRLEVLRRLEEHGHLDLLITDFHLGSEGSGVEVIATVRERLGAALPAILLSGDTSRDVQELARDERWLMASKPLQAEQLLALMSRLLGGV